jgi:8-oxo-dGTP pyrophosphatase MutT (NUDIX family)
MQQHIDEHQSIDFYNSRPTIRTGGGVLIFNHEGELLLVKPTYRNTWSWPGGGSDPGESPLTAAIRELLEELGINVSLRPAFVNYIPPRPDGTLDVIHFVFIAETVDDTFTQRLKLPKEEIEVAKFVPIAELGNYMKDYRVRAVKTYLDHKPLKGMLYLEDGQLA